MFNWLKVIRKKWWNSLVGLTTAIKEEKSLWTYLFIIPIIIGLGFWVNLSVVKWAIVVLVIVMTLVVEIINTALESAVDAMSFQYNIKVKKIKDIAAGATLISTLGAIIILLIIFIDAIGDKI